MSSGQGREYDNETSNLNIACDPKACGSVAFFDEGPNDGGRACVLRAVRRGRWQSPVPSVFGIRVSWSAVLLQNVVQL